MGIFMCNLGTVLQLVIVRLVAANSQVSKVPSNLFCSLVSCVM